MLKQRILTAVILIPFIIGAIFFSNPAVIGLVGAVIVIAAAWEWCQLFEYSLIERTGYITLVGIALVLSTQIAIMNIIAMALMFWLVAMLSVLSYKPGQHDVGSKWAVSFVGLLMFIPFWLSLIMLANNSAWALMSLLLLVWTADIGAYFGGKTFGKHKLIQAVSPNKTWEGVIAGLVCVLLVAAILYYFVGHHISMHLKIAGLSPWMMWMLTALIIFVVSVFGDLFESVIKRIRGVKDSGTCLPGHGGMLDRVDSLLATAPVFVFLLGA